MNFFVKRVDSMQRMIVEIFIVYTGNSQCNERLSFFAKVLHHIPLYSVNQNQKFPKCFSTLMFSRKFSENEEYSNSFSWQYGKTRNSLSLNFFSWNQLFSNFFSKNVTFTKFLPKMSGTKSQQFPHCRQWISRFSTLSFSPFFGKNFVKATHLLKKLLKSWFDEIVFWWEKFFLFSTLCTFNLT